jgi:hypothetical protein
MQYLSDNLPVFNILQTITAHKPLNPEISSPKYQNHSHAHNGTLPFEMGLIPLGRTCGYHLLAT